MCIFNLFKYFYFSITSFIFIDFIFVFILYFYIFLFFKFFSFFFFFFFLNQIVTFLTYFNKFLGSELISPWGLVQKTLKSKPNLEDTKVDKEDPRTFDDLKERV